MGSTPGKPPGALARPPLVPERCAHHEKVGTDAVLCRYPARAWLKLAQNHIYVVPQNQGMTMNANAESKAASKVINGRINGRFASGHSGNPGGSPEATRRLVNKAFLEALAEDFRQGGAQAIAKVRKEQPAAYMKICALLVPREMKLEHSGGVKAMSDEQLERAIEVIEELIRQRDAGESAKVVEAVEALPRLPAKDG